MRTRATALVASLAAAAAVLAGCSSTSGTARPVADEVSTAASTSGSTTTTAGPSDTTNRPDTPSASTTSTGAFRITESPDVRVNVEVIEDMACPACQMFQKSYGTTLEKLAKTPGVAVDYRIISFLDRMSSDDYSSRAANASYCVWNRPGSAADRATVWQAFQTAAFDAQPAEGGAGLPDSQLAAIASRAGATDVAACITANRYASDVKETTSRTTADKSFRGTPTTLINGKTVDVSSPADMMSKVMAALGK